MSRNITIIMEDLETGTKYEDSVLLDELNNMFESQGLNWLTLITMKLNGMLNKTLNEKIKTPLIKK